MNSMMQGAILTVLGMALVFAVLGLDALTIFLIGRFFREDPVSVAGKGPGPEDRRMAAAAAAAVEQYERDSRSG